MTQADTASAVRRSLDSESTQRGQGPAAKMTDPLPDGWTHFCSARDDRCGNPGRWYATAPWIAHKVAGHTAGLVQTVYAATWPALHEKVAEQIELYRALTGEAV